MVQVNFLKNTLLYLLGDSLNKVVMFVAIPILANNFTKLEYANLELTLSIVALLTVMLNPGLSNAMVRNFWDTELKNSPNQKAVTTTFQLIVLTSTLIILIYFLTFQIMSNYLDSEIFWFIFKLKFTLIQIAILNQLINLNIDIIKMRFEPYKILIVQFISKFACISVLTWLVVLDTIGVRGFLVFQLPFLITAFFLSLYLVEVRLVSFIIDIQTCKDFIKYGMPFFFTAATLLIFGTVDRWMLLSTWGESAVAEYSVAFRYSLILTLLPYAIAQTWSSLVHKIYHSRKTIAPIIYADFFLLFLSVTAVTCCAVILVGDLLVLKTVGIEYKNAVMPFMLCCIGVFIQCTQLITAYGITVRGKSICILKAAIFGAFCNLFLNIILIPLFDVVGAAVASIFGYFTYTAVLFYYSNFYIPLRLSRNVIMKNLLLLMGLVGSSLAVYFYSISKFSEYLRVFHLILIISSVYFVVFYNERRVGRLRLLLSGKMKF